MALTYSPHLLTLLPLYPNPQSSNILSDRLYSLQHTLSICLLPLIHTIWYMVIYILLSHSIRYHTYVSLHLTNSNLLSLPHLLNHYLSKPLSISIPLTYHTPISPSPNPHSLSLTLTSYWIRCRTSCL